jgi:cytochrome P450
MTWLLQSEAPWLYTIMKIAVPSFIRKCDRANQNVVDYGLYAARRTKSAELSKHNIISGMIEESRAEKTAVTDFGLGSQASALIVAGSDTTAITLTYAVWALFTHPNARRKLEDEVAELPEGYDDSILEKLPYLNAVVMEVLRLYGSAPGGEPRVVPSRGIEIQGKYIPGGAVLTTQAFSMHRDSSIYPDPLR